MCKVQSVLVNLYDDPEELDVDLKNIELNIPKWLHPEIFKIVRRGITRIRMNPNVDESINILDVLIENCGETLKQLEQKAEDELLLETY